MGSTAILVWHVSDNLYSVSFVFCIVAHSAPIYNVVSPCSASPSYLVTSVHSIKTQQLDLPVFTYYTNVSKQLQFHLCHIFLVASLYKLLHLLSPKSILCTDLFCNISFQCQHLSPTIFCISCAHSVLLNIFLSSFFRTRIIYANCIGMSCNLVFSESS